MSKEQDREAFEKAIRQPGMHVNLTRIGPADSNAGDYADVIVRTCWTIWQLALAYCREKQDTPTMTREACDTRFQGFAELLFEELHQAGDVWFDDRWKTVIARRAYDLVKHTILNIGPADLDILTTEECVQRVPDMDEWTKEDQ